jgi:hypothetical protein
MLHSGLVYEKFSIRFTQDIRKNLSIISRFHTLISTHIWRYMICNISALREILLKFSIFLFQVATPFSNVFCLFTISFIFHLFKDIYFRFSLIIINSVFNKSPAMTMSIPMISKSMLTIDIAKGNCDVVVYSLKA